MSSARRGAAFSFESDPSVDAITRAYMEAAGGGTRLRLYDSPSLIPSTA
jgi:hypothetical protein